MSAGASPPSVAGVAGGTPSRGLSAAYGVLHAAVDAATVTAVFRAVSAAGLEPAAAFLAVTLYDLEAFAGQAPLGWAIDRLRRPRLALVVGTLLAAAALLAVPLHPWLVVGMAGLGNALFHLGAGFFALRIAPRRALHPGIFVAPGALGLAFGVFYGRDTAGGPLWPLVLLPLLLLAVSLPLRRPSVEGPVEPPDRPHPPRAVLLLMLLLLLSIAVRSFVGMGGCRGCPRTDLVRWGVPLAAFLGKLLGGWVSDRLGWIRASVGALLLSAPLLAFGAGSPALLLPGLLLFQMTMPVTLAAASLALPRHTATAFGLGCLALVLGALPTFHPAGRALVGPGLVLGLVLLSAAALFVALRLLGGSQGGRAAARGPW